MINSRRIVHIACAACVSALCAASVSAQTTQAGQPAPASISTQTQAFNVAYATQKGDIAGFAGMVIGPGPDMERIVKNAPFSAQGTTTTTQVLADGNRIVQTQEMTLARDSDGRTRREMSVDKVGPWSTDSNGKVVFIRDPVAGATYVLQPDGQHAIKTTMHAPPEGGGEPALVVKKQIMEQGLQAKGEALRTESRMMTRNGVVQSFIVGEETSSQQMEKLGDQTIEGVRAHGTRETRTIAAGAIGNERPIEIVSEVWYSPDLQMIVLSKHTDPRVGETVYKLSNIQIAEPDPTLFQVPASYTVQQGPATFEVRVPPPAPAKNPEN